MGLDMSLNKKTYVKNWSHMKPEERHEVDVKKSGVQVSHIKPERVSYVEEEIIRWRKANAIHAWFVENVQDGEDDCKDHWVSKSDLETLLGLCERVIEASELVEGKIKNGYTFENGKEVPIMEDGKYIKDSTVAQELLPAQEGFFFGGTDYDEYYLEDIKFTAKKIKEVLAEDTGSGFSTGDFYYHSSW